MTPEPRTEKKRVLFFWAGNSAASQMAEGLLRHDAGEYFEVESAGTRPDAVRPEAIAVLHEVGIDIRGHRSKHIDERDKEISAASGRRTLKILFFCDTEASLPADDPPGPAWDPRSHRRALLASRADNSA
jgi:hypothetical protein